MIDLRRLRDEPAYRGGIERKRVAPGVIDDVLTLDAQQRELQKKVEDARRDQNAASKAIGKAAPEERPALVEAAGALKVELTEAEAMLTTAEAAARELALQVPNPADASVPDGGEDDGAVLREVGERAGMPCPTTTKRVSLGWSSISTASVSSP